VVATLNQHTKKEEVMNIIELNPHGDISIDVGSISRVDLEDIKTVRSYKITRDETGDITHEILFSNEGSFSIIYTEDGKVKKFHGHHVSITHTKDNILILRMITSAT
jgi:hypothetical protein